MKDDRLLLGIDIGTSSSKGVLVSLDGRLVAEQAVPHGFEIPQPGWAEQDADAIWWHDFCTISRGLITAANIDPARIAGVACSAIAPTMLPLDENYKPLRPSILYGIDTRAGQEIDDLTTKFGEDEIFARTGQITFGAVSRSQGTLVSSSSARTIRAHAQNRHCINLPRLPPDRSLCRRQLRRALLRALL